MPYAKTTSYLPIVDLLKELVGIEDRDEPQTVRNKLTEKIIALDCALKAHLPSLLSLLDIPIDDQQWSTLDPPQRRRRTMDALKHLMFRESEVRPVLMILEDLPLDRHRNPGCARWARSATPSRPFHVTRKLPIRISACVGEPFVLHEAHAGSLASRRRRKVPRGLAGIQLPPRPAEAPTYYPNRGQSFFPGRECKDTGRDGNTHRETRRL